ncbi:MAG: hypothetical protein WC761_01260 [Candidatus Paceibacterota bacterium]
MKRVSLKESIQELFANEVEQQVSPQEPDSLEANPEAEIAISPQDEATLRSLETGIEREINKSVDDAALEPISEGASQGGFDYEGTVLKAIGRAGIRGNITKGAGASAAAADADIKVNGQVYNIEVKLDKNAQMGGSSVRFGSQGISLVKPMEPDTQDILISAISSKAAELNKMIGYIAKQAPRAVNKRVTGFPMSCTKDGWESAAAKGLLVNTRFRHTTDFIAKHYAKKGIYYIQIGGAGLFYMAGNPANLPIPQLTGEINIEIRSARSGSKPLKSGIEVVGGGIRVQARLKTKGKSPYTADDPKSLIAMIAAMKVKTAANPKAVNPPRPPAKKAVKEE